MIDVLNPRVLSRPTLVRRALKAAVRNPAFSLGGALVTLVALVALGAPIISPYHPHAQVAEPLLLPGEGHILGTDEFGRDMLSRVVWGARSSLYAGLLSVMLAVSFGASCGLVAGFYGGWVDNILMRAMDILFSLPPIVLAIVITAILGPSLTNAMIAIGVVYTPTFARVIRGPTLTVVRLQYVEAARALGLREARIMLRHVLPNVSAPLLVQSTVSASTAILTEAGLSFLGLGTQPPSPSWGLMLSAARQYMLLDPWLVVLPGSAIAVTVLGFNLLGDGLRDILDPRIRPL